ncbi:energy transducer TonB [Geofilum rubicundum]|uniref:Regulatory sensor-transducer, BlaR1/MecR1 family n=1 Tax=Geofilum rubicundum JCM 15548 TaxID=1236989 RepID=A0A0E9LWW2_9BACT|nr:energy transducer TonB [Geofilum rubicundum]GAO30052.1 regulatory sensor-transducer, BlaR1/MecR1 family [Geofilum rubicundum JCM 15548]
MEVKKAPRCDLETKRSVFLQIGLIVSLALSLVAFEWSSAVEASTLDFYGVEMDVPVEIIPITTHKEVEKPPMPKSVDLLLIEDNFSELEETLDLGSSELEPDAEWDWAALEGPAEEREEVLLLADEMPEFPGGEKALFQFLSSSVRYPREAISNEIEGRVYVEFVVDRHGKITRVNVKRGVHPSLDQEALRVIESMPDWKPGVKDGQLVNVLFTVPISFQIAHR